MRPMMASRGTAVPLGPGWVHEIKWDGMRVLARPAPVWRALTTRALGLSAQGRLRQPAYRRIRLDLSPSDLADQG
ncbi:MAG: bifunctional non-ous end joining protein LigD [Actinomycetota bacterium]|jgi:hypothetical protein|nr:bifunctional non-ous end joining protein LigD [Actinomycetota bacterium]